MANYQSIVPTKLGQIAMTTATAVAYTVPSNTRTMVKNFDMCNTNNTLQTFSIYLVPAGQSPSTSNALFYNNNINGYSSIQWSGVEILNQGDMIYVQGSSSGITIYISGAECT